MGCGWLGPLLERMPIIQYGKVAGRLSNLAVNLLRVCIDDCYIS
jgi:hypothetical protein